MQYAVFPSMFLQANSPHFQLKITELSGAPQLCSTRRQKETATTLGPSNGWNSTLWILVPCRMHVTGEAQLQCLADLPSGKQT
jgi:hypothetical protein